MQRTSRLFAQLLQQRCGQSLPASYEATVSQLLCLGSGCLQQQIAAGHVQLQHGWITAAGWTGPGVRHMAGRTHKLSLKHANNKASWRAVQPFLRHQPGAAAAAAVAAAAGSPAPKPEPIDTAIPPLPQLQEPPQHRCIGKITGPFAVTRQAAFAVVESGGAQFKVTPDDVIYHNKILHVQVNDVLQLGRVLLLGSQSETTVGRPYIPGASVIGVVEEVLQDAKVHVFKKKKRKGYSKLQGHRSHVTVLRIVELRAPGLQQQLAAAAASASSSVGGNAAAVAAAAAAGEAEAMSRAPVQLLKGQLKNRPPALVGLAVGGSAQPAAAGK